ncbi:MAG: DUF3313 domain-containing protein [Gammaproteobacteria bacterium]|nr:DUF3313 domain-containing protein [Gammaproteobacteria bacterium]MDH3749627.1 DUF3313 domain-containing protein [Gammaproteobacteria bacterium]
MKDERIFAQIGIGGLTLLALGLAGCAASTPTIDTSPEAELTYDGLHPLKGTRADAAWVRPGSDISQYSKIVLQGVGVEYRPGGESGRTFHDRAQGGPFEVTPKQRENFERVVSEAFREELARSEQFELVEEAGPEVLLIIGGLVDVVSYVPPEPAGMAEIYLSRVAEATLVLEIRDSITQATLARVVDRRAAERAFEMTQSNRVNNKSEVRRLANTWARLLRTRLDELASR